jgi:hypothetical protein
LEYKPRLDPHPRPAVHPEVHPALELLLASIDPLAGLEFFFPG